MLLGTFLPVGDLINAKDSQRTLDRQRRSIANRRTVDSMICSDRRIRRTNNKNCGRRGST